ncbi:MAG TPA: hypothetical protein VFW16_01000 [Streptosporangiaceae bacterium]|nr:hypothetical protein [Streptosporangiaceae bacterium]
MERYVLRGGKFGYERLQLLARVHRPDTAELFQLAGVGPGMRCLDTVRARDLLDFARHHGFRREEVIAILESLP